MAMCAQFVLQERTQQWAHLPDANNARLALSLAAREDIPLVPPALPAILL